MEKLLIPSLFYIATQIESHFDAKRLTLLFPIRIKVYGWDSRFLYLENFASIPLCHSSPLCSSGHLSVSASNLVKMFLLELGKPSLWTNSLGFTLEAKTCGQSLPSFFISVNIQISSWGNQMTSLSTMMSHGLLCCLLVALGLDCSSMEWQNLFTITLVKTGNIRNHGTLIISNPCFQLLKSSFQT